MYKYNDIIEYLDGTFDPYLTGAFNWCKWNNAECVELVEEREQREEGLIRKFKIIENVVPELTQAEKEEDIRIVRNSMLLDTDRVMLEDYPITAEEREQYKAYRSYLRDYTKCENWWKQEPMSFEVWLGVVNTLAENNPDSELSVEPENKAQSNEVEDEE